jgi:hypothetical protein
MNTVAARYKEYIIFTRSTAGIVGLNPNWGRGVCLHLFCVWAVLYVGSGHATGWSLSLQGVIPTVKKIQETEKVAKAQQRAVEP